MSGAGKELDPPSTEDPGPIAGSGRQPSPTYVPKHDRELTHFGLLEASLVEIVAELSYHAEGTDLMEVLTDIDARISVLESTP